MSHDYWKCSKCHKSWDGALNFCPDCEPEKDPAFVGAKFHGPDDEVPVGGKPSELHGCEDKGCPHYGTPHGHARRAGDVCYGQINDPDGATRHAGKWLAEVEREQAAELAVDVPSDVAFIVAGTDTERTARKLVQDGTALQVMEHVLALYGLKMERTEDAEAIVQLQSLHGSLYFREFWERDDEGNVVKHGKPVTDMPGWVVAFEESLRPKDEPAHCYICNEVLGPGELIQPHKHPLTGAKLWRHVNDCAL